MSVRELDFCDREGTELIDRDGRDKPEKDVGSIWPVV